MISRKKKAGKTSRPARTLIESKYESKVVSSPSTAPLRAPRGARGRPRTVGLAQRARQIPVVSSVLSAARTRVRGTEFLATVTGVTTATTGTTLLTQLISSQSLGVGRLKAFSTLYEKYRFRSFSIRYSPIANATVSGQIMGYFDTDPTEIAPPTGLAAFQRGIAHFGAKTSQVWEERSYALTDDDPQRMLYTSQSTTAEATTRQVYQARFTLMAASTLPAVALGNLYVDYDVEFSCPQIDSQPTGGGSSVLLTPTNAASSSAVLGSAPVSSAGSNLIITGDDVSDNTFWLEPGSYLAVLRIAGTGVLDPAITTSGTTYKTDGCGNVAATSGVATLRFASTERVSLTLACTATTYNGGYSYLYVARCADVPPEMERKSTQPVRAPAMPLVIEQKSPSSKDFTFVEPIRSRSVNRTAASSR